MDTTNFSDTPHDKLICTNAACNTDPVVCAFCGFKDYIQTFSQPNCFRPFCSGTPRCKKPSENCEDGFSVHEPIFSSPPLLQPLFHNRLVPPNVFYSNLNMADSTSNQFVERQTNRATQSEKISGQPHVFMHYQGDGATIQKNDQVNQNSSANTEADNPTKMQINPFSFIPMCPCSNFVPWTCNPYIMPMISYYVSWNSLRTSENFSPSNRGTPSDKDTEKTKETLATQNKSDLNEEQCEKKCNTDFSKDADSKRVNKYENDESGIQGKLEKIESKISKEFNTSSTSFVSISSLDFGEDIITIIDRKKNENKAQSKIFFSSKHMAEISAEKKNYDHVDETQEVINESKNIIKSPLEGHMYKEGLAISPDSLHLSFNDTSEEMVNNLQSIEGNDLNHFQFSYSQMESDDTSLESSKNSSLEKLKEELQASKDRIAQNSFHDSTMEDQVKSETDDGASPSISTTGTAAAGDLMENILENRKDPIEVDQNINSEPDVTNSQDESVQDVELVVTEKKKKPFLKGIEGKVKEQSSLKALRKMKPSSCKLPVNIRQRNSNTIKQSKEESWDNFQHPIRRQHYCSTPENKAESSEGLLRSRKPKFLSAVPNRATENLKLKNNSIKLRGSAKKSETAQFFKLQSSVAIEKEDKFSCKSRK